MATVGIISIGLRVDSAKVSEGFKKAEGSVSTFSHKIEATVGGLKASTAGIVGLAAGVGAAAANLFQAASSSVVAGVEKVAAGLVHCVAAGSDLSESVSKTGVIFGDSAGIVTATADEMADRFGMVKSKTLEAASDIGQIAKASKLSENAAARLSSQFTQLAGDVSSIANVEFTDVLGAIKSGLVGEAEPLRKFGVLLSEQAVRSRAAAMGLAVLGQDLDESSKVQARAAIIADQLAYASGDLERTQFGVANSSRAMGGRLENIAAQFGQLLEPIAETGLAIANFAMSSIVDQLTGSEAAIKSFTEAAAGSGGYVVQAFVGVGQAVGWVLDVFQRVSAAVQVVGAVLKAAFMPVINSIVAAIDYLAKNVEWINATYSNVAGVLGGGFTAGGVMSMGANSAAGAIKDTLKAMGEPPPSTKWNAWIQSIADKAGNALNAFRNGAGSPGVKPNVPTASGPSEKELKALQDRQKKLGEQAKSVWQSQLDPVEKLAMKLAEINELEREGFLTAEQAARARTAEAGGFAAKGASRQVGAAGFGSAEAYKAVVSYRADKSDSLKSLPDLTATGNRILAEQRDLLKRISAKTGATDPNLGTNDGTMLALAN